MTAVLAVRVHAADPDDPARPPAPAAELLRAGAAAHRLRVVAIGCAFRTDETVRLRALGAPGDAEARLLGELARVLDRFAPTVVTWDGAPHDLPLLALRAFANGVPLAGCLPAAGAARRAGDARSPAPAPDPVDLVDALGLRAAAPLGLDDMAQACGLPAPRRLAGGGRAGPPDPRAACEIEAATVLLLWRRLQGLRGEAERADDDADRLRAAAAAGASEPLRRFARALGAG